MKTAFVGTIVAFLAFAIGEVAARNAEEQLGKLPVCAQACITSAFATCKCKMLDVKCACSCNDFQRTSETCTSSSCAESHLKPVLDVLDGTCRAIPSSSSASLPLSATTSSSGTLTPSVPFSTSDPTELSIIVATGSIEQPITGPSGPDHAADQIGPTSADITGTGGNTLATVTSASQPTAIPSDTYMTSPIEGPIPTETSRYQSPTETSDTYTTSDSAGTSNADKTGTSTVESPTKTAPSRLLPIYTTFPTTLNQTSGPGITPTAYLPANSTTTTTQYTYPSRYVGCNGTTNGWNGSAICTSYTGSLSTSYTGSPYTGGGTVGPDLHELWMLSSVLLVLGWLIV